MKMYVNQLRNKIQIILIDMKYDSKSQITLEEIIELAKSINVTVPGIFHRYDK